MSTAAPPVTPEDLLRMGDAGKGYELVNGELREVEMSTDSSRVGVKITGRVEPFVDAHELGTVVGPDAGFQCFPDDPGKVRRPDLAFLSVATLPPDEYDPEGFCDTAPDLVVEVISPGDSAREVEAKIKEWFSAGVKLLWEVFPDTRTIRIHRPDGTSSSVQAPGMLTAPDLLPGFAVPVADLFRRVGEPRQAPSPPVQ
jgi:Uma2 family endonuclease